jgi:hypothetical protein
VRCLFCKRESAWSRSVEHIVPESLGNVAQTLPPGIVCDQCNNYFAGKVEKPFLESAALTLLRFHQEIPSKRGHVAAIEGELDPGFRAILRRHPGSRFVASIELPPEGIHHLLGQQNSRLLVPGGADLPSGVVVSRFLAKAAIEAMAQRLLAHPDGLDYLVDEPQLDPLRNHARRGDVRDWPFHSRRIYNANARWVDEEGVSIQVVFEFDIMVTDWSEWFFVIAIFGMELVINYGGPEIDGYERWLSLNKGASPLHSGKNGGGWPRMDSTGIG